MNGLPSGFTFLAWSMMYELLALGVVVRMVVVNFCCDTGRMPAVYILEETNAASSTKMILASKPLNDCGAERVSGARGG